MVYNGKAIVVAYGNQRVLNSLIQLLLNTVLNSELKDFVEERNHLTKFKTLVQCFLIFFGLRHNLGLFQN